MPIAADELATIEPVSVSNFPATQAVSIIAAQTIAAVTVVNAVTAITNALPAGSNIIGAANVNVANVSTVTVMQNAVAVTGNGTSLSVTGYGTSVLQITGSFVATIAFEASVDAGVTWLAISATQVGQGDIFNVATLPGLYRLTVSGMDLIRARVTWTSGTSITINGRSTNAVNASKIVKLATGGLSIGTVQMASLAKGTQGATGVSTQDLKDAGRNPVHYYTVIPVLSTATDTLQSLTGTKAGATVVATTTPAVVTTGKTLRVTRVAATYISTAVSGYGIVRLRFNTAGVVAITSPVAATLAIGNGSPTVVNAGNSEEATLSDGWEFAAATGIGISVQGFAAVTAAAVGYVLVSVTGYEY